ncbi:hypothetical protein [Halomonas gemina]|nr:hypothetical protein [Halomonas gemina]
MTAPSDWVFRAALIATVAAIMAGIWCLLQELGLPMSFSPSGIAG